MVLPKDRYYLAATVFDLKEIVKWYGNGETEPVELCGDKIVWFSPSRPTKSSCRAEKSKCQVDYSQLPVSSNFFDRILRNKDRHQFDLNELQDSGAVIFGHNKNLEFHFPDIGDPEEDHELLPPAPNPGQITTPSLSESSQTSFYDSGIGSGNIPSTAETGCVSEQPRASMRFGGHQHLGATRLTASRIPVPKRPEHGLTLRTSLGGFLRRKFPNPT